MQIKLHLRKAAELGMGLTAIATLILAGCGGGGGGSTAAAGSTQATTTAVTVTPGKGIMIGAVVNIADASSNLLGSGTTTSAGTTTIAIPATATGPFIFSVSCPASCQYWDEKTLAMVSGVANAPFMQAVVPTAAYFNNGVGVTAATNAAAQFILANGAPLTVASAVAVTSTVVQQLNLPAGINIFTPPTIIQDRLTQTNALAGSAVPDLLADISARLAMAASGVSALQAIADYGNAWKQAALTPASGVILPATINPTLVGSAVPVMTIPDVASAVAATATAQAAFQPSSA